MVVGLAYRGCCIPLACWCYHPKAWPLAQVRPIEELLCWVPDDTSPLLQADRGIGTSPDLIRVVTALGWQYLFRVQGQTHFQLPDGQSIALQDLVTSAGRWSAQGHVFKKAGWLDCMAHLIWDLPYSQAWCLVTARVYAQRYWQEAAFRDLKSDGWHWQNSPVFIPTMPTCSSWSCRLLMPSPCRLAPWLLSNPRSPSASWTSVVPFFAMAYAFGNLR